MTGYIRPLAGYGPSPPDAGWPGGARIALSFVINYEEGGELAFHNGDPQSESRLTDLAGTIPIYGARDPQVESLYEYGSRVGIWRLLRFFQERQLPFTLFAVGRALELRPIVADQTLEAGGELVPHGWRWIDYRDVPPEVEQEHITRCVDLIRSVSGERPVGWYTGRPSPNTRTLVVREGGFIYDSDAYNDDLPYWDFACERPHLVIPYSLDANDGRLAAGGDFATAAHFSAYLCDAFDCLYAEGRRAPRLMSVGLHCRIIGRPGRMKALDTFVRHVQAHSGVWVCQRSAVARHWLVRFPPT